jgi:uncharacterized protein YmfQ (DUF2313 family)
MTIFNEITQTQQANILSQYVRDDRLHQAKNKDNSNLRKILLGLASEFVRFRDKANLIYDEYNPKSTTDFITEWETQVGIPDDCFSNTGTLEERRTNILLKLAGINTTTAEQFKNIASILGYNISVSTGIDTSVFPLQLPFILIDQVEAPFTIVITLPASEQADGLPLELPFTLTSEAPEILQCLFNKIKPAHCNIIFRYS